ncbi:hypothetical protein COOONC_00160 [Cooperia oncophora]
MTDVKDMMMHRVYLIVIAYHCLVYFSDLLFPRVRLIITFISEMNSISRAVTSRFNDISNKRQRLVGEGKDSDFVNPSWTDPTTSDFNCFEPPELIISEEDGMRVL